MIIIQLKFMLINSALCSEDHTNLNNEAQYQ